MKLFRAVHTTRDDVTNCRQGKVCPHSISHKVSTAFLFVQVNIVML
jgi:hypothetical protein